MVETSRSLIGDVDVGHSGLSPGRRPLTTTEKALVGLEGFLSLCGLGGGIYLTALPVTAMPLRYLEGTWFHDWRWPGLALFLLLGVCPALTAAATLRHHQAALVGHLCVGAGLCAWVILEAAWVVASPPLQVPMGLVGMAILALGIVQLVRGEPGHRLGARGQE